MTKPIGKLSDLSTLLEDKRISGAITVSEVNGPDIKAMNDFDKKLVGVQSKTISASGGALTYSLPPHSYTQFQMTLA